MSDEKLLSKYPVYLVGSVLWKENPRDIDIVCILPNRDFRKIFGISAKTWIQEGKTGQWSKERYNWAERTMKISNLLQGRLKLNLDFKFVPSAWHGKEKK